MTWRWTWKTSWCASRFTFSVARQPASALPRELRRDAEQLPRERVVLRGEVVERRDVLARDDEQVHRRLRVDVLESHDVRVLMDELRGDLPLDDLAEQAVRHVVLHEGAQGPRL